MTTKFQQQGDIVNYINAGSAIVAGAVVKMVNTIGIALTDIAATTGVGAVAVEGVFANVPKVAGRAWVLGEKLFWDVSTSSFDTVAGTLAAGDVTGCAIAWAAAGSADTVGVIKLTPGNTAIT